MARAARDRAAARDLRADAPVPAPVRARVRLSAIAALALLASAAVRADDAWTLARRSDGISVYTRRIEGSPLKAFKGDVEIESTVDRVVDVIADPASFVRWLPDAIECRELKRTGTERFVYVETHAPWPVSNRDGVYHFTFSREGDAATVRVEALPDFIARREGRVRVTRSDGSWRIEPSTHGVRASYEIHADPGGWVPAWLANLTVVKMPYETLRNLRALLTPDRRSTSPAP